MEIYLLCRYFVNFLAEKCQNTCKNAQKLVSLHAFTSQVGLNLNFDKTIFAI